jgi:DNA-directed RNA polymerase subunit RPC12/RpoP
MKLIKDLGFRYPTENSKQRHRYGLYKCEYCGNNFEAKTSYVKTKRTTKCKSCARRIAKTKHGDSRTKLYSTLVHMKQRCYDSNVESFKYYGARGIKICEEWKNSYQSFKEWALSNGYEEHLSIDRINNDGDYEPSNCRWATKETQARNTRKLIKTNTSGYRGVSEDKKHGGFKAGIKASGKTTYLGKYKTAKEAGRAYDDYVIKNKLSHTTNFQELKQ